MYVILLQLDVDVSYLIFIACFRNLHMLVIRVLNVSSAGIYASTSADVPLSLIDGFMFFACLLDLFIFVSRDGLCAPMFLDFLGFVFAYFLIYSL